MLLELLLAEVAVRIVKIPRLKWLYEVVPKKTKQNQLPPLEVCSNSPVRQDGARATCVRDIATDPNVKARSSKKEKNQNISIVLRK